MSAERKAMQEWKSLLHGMQNAADDEASVVRQLKFQPFVGKLHTLLGTPEVHGARFEMPLSVGIADLVLIHVDHGVTLVEAKGPLDRRSVAAGIGQLFLYETALQELEINGARPAFVSKILCAPMPPDDAVVLTRACDLAGVRFVPMIDAPLLREIANKFKAGDV